MTARTSTRGETPAPAVGVDPSLAAWTRGTTAGTLAITLLDALLLQQKKAFFTGGFLAGTHATSLSQTLGFLAAGTVVDAGFVGLAGFALLWAAARIQLTSRARAVLVAAGSIAPLIALAFINYSLLGHFGDAFDLGLMFDLTGRSTSEVFAVASAHILAPAALLLAGAIAVAMLVWIANRREPAASRRSAPIGRRLAGAASALFLFGLLTFGVASTTSDLAEDGLRRKASGQVFTRLLTTLTDFDRDGFGVVGRAGDPAPFDASIFPYAPDVPGNGIDEDAVGGDLPLSTPPYVESVEPIVASDHRPDVVLFVLESFRADAVGRTINGRQVTPTLDALAAEGVSSAHAFSHNGYTTQSRYHLLTGSLAGLRGGSLIDDFKARGYETAYFSAQDESFGGPEYSVGFDKADVHYDARDDRQRRYTTFTTAGSLAVSHVTLRERIEQFLQKRSASRPLFLYVNFHDTHFPYHHRDIATLVSDRVVAQERIDPAHAADVREMYYNTAANVDRAVGATVDVVGRTTGRTPAVIVTADHGESLFDEGFLGHGYALNEAQTRIPLIVRGLPMEIAEPFAQADLRGAIAAALSRRAGDAAVKPRAFVDPGKMVFQYLGSIRRPREIAVASATTRLVYDFRDRRVVADDGRRVAPETLSGGPAERLLRLVHFWEQMILARVSGRQNRDE